MDSGIIPVMLLFATEKKEAKPRDLPISVGMEFLERLLSLPMRSRGTVPLKKLEESERTLSLPTSNMDLGIDPFRLQEERVKVVKFEKLAKYSGTVVERLFWSRRMKERK
uniref:Uncharacterized protein n=1 Tax=Solanum lycopersicum TaxID=4081 RepID=A0A3Q7IRM1_SOLLC